MGCDPLLANVIQLGFGFFLVFSAFQSCSNIQEYVINSVSSHPGNSSSTIDAHAGYNSLAIIYGVFTIFNFFAPVIVNKISNKWSMVIGASIYVLFLLSFLYLNNWIFYSVSAILGLGAALIWVGQGSYLAENSKPETVSRNSGIFWAILQCSLPFGGIFIYTQLKQDSSGKADLSLSTVEFIFIGFSIMAVLGTLVLAFLRHSRSTPESSDLAHLLSSDPESVSGTPTDDVPVVISADSYSPNVDSVLRADASQESPEDSLMSTLSRIVFLLKTKSMIFLSIVFIFTGLELTFWSGVYSTAIANTLKFTTSPKELLALNTIFVGIGEIIGGGLFGILGSKFSNKFGRNPVIILAMIVHLIVFFLIFLNIPMDATLKKTEEISYITPVPNEYLALFCSVLIGFGDACWNTQIYSLLSSFYADDSAAAFGLFKFFQSGSACAAFFYSSHLLLHEQLGIMAVLAPVATVAFFQVEWRAQISTFNHEKHP